MYETIQNEMFKTIQAEIGVLKGICSKEEIDFVFTKRGAKGLDDLSPNQYEGALSDIYALKNNYS